MWMTDLYTDYLRNRPLSQITLPGTHDSGCSILDPAAQTQALSIAAQLAGGIRYFDLRPFKKNDDTYHTWHGPLYTGESFASIIAAITGYITGNPGANRELIILNISHFHKGRMGFYPWTAQEHYDFINYLATGIGVANLVPHTQATTNLFGANYSALLTDAHAAIASRVAIIYDGAMDAGEPVITYLDALGPNRGAGAIGASGGAFVTDGAGGACLRAGFFILAKYSHIHNPMVLFDRYSDTNDLATMRTRQHERLTHRDNENYAPGRYGVVYGANAMGGVANTMHLFSWTCTYGVGGMWNPLLTQVDQNVNPYLRNYFIDHISFPAVHGYDPMVDPKINIIYVDHFASHHLPQFLFAAHPDAALGGLPMPVAIAAKLNKYGTLGTAQAWTGWGW